MEPLILYRRRILLILKFYNQYVYHILGFDKILNRDKILVGTGLLSWISGTQEG